MGQDLGGGGVAVDPTIVVALFVGVLTLFSVLWKMFSTSSASWYEKKKKKKLDRIAEAKANCEKKFQFDVDAVALECQKTGQPWKDPSFGHDEYPGGKSIGNMELRDGERGTQLVLGKDGVTWQPPWKFSPLNRPMGIRYDGVPTWLYSDNDNDGIVSAAESMEVSDVLQGSVGNCYFLAAVSAVVQHYPDIADELIDETYEEQGIYGVSLWTNGKWQMVWVDCYFPCYRPDGKSHRGKHRLIFANPDDGKEIWMLVVEKAFAKLSGSYEAISGGYISKALEMLTGGTGQRFSTKKLSRSSEEWNKVKEWIKSDEYIVGAGSQQQRWYGGETAVAEQKKTMQGIVPGHAYTVLNVYEEEQNDDDGEEEESLRLIELRNPWGRVMYHGDWGSGSKKWNSEEGRKAKSVIGYSSRTQEGRFWMDWNDFVGCFDSIDVCYMNFTDEDRAHRAELREEAAAIVSKKDRPHRKDTTNMTSKHKKGHGETLVDGAEYGDYTQESADAMMELLLAEEAREQRMQKKKNKKSRHKRKH